MIISNQCDCFSFDICGFSGLTELSAHCFLHMPFSLRVSPQGPGYKAHKCRSPRPQGYLIATKMQIATVLVQKWNIIGKGSLIWCVCACCSLMAFKQLYLIRGRDSLDYFLYICRLSWNYLIILYLILLDIIHNYVPYNIWTYSYLNTKIRVHSKGDTRNTYTCTYIKI